MSYPRRKCIGSPIKRSDNLWFKTLLFPTAHVLILEFVRPQNMVMMVPSRVDALPSDSNNTPHIRQKEKCHQLRTHAWRRISEATLVSLSARTDVGRHAVIVANTRCRTGDIAKAYFQLMSTLRVPMYKFNKTLLDKEFFSPHVTDITEGAASEQRIQPWRPVHDRPAEDEVPPPPMLRGSNGQRRNLLCQRKSSSVGEDTAGMGKRFRT